MEWSCRCTVEHSQNQISECSHFLISFLLSHIQSRTRKVMCTAFTDSQQRWQKVYVPREVSKAFFVACCGVVAPEHYEVAEAEETHHWESCADCDATLNIVGCQPKCVRALLEPGAPPLECILRLLQGHPGALWKTKVDGSQVCADPGCGLLIGRSPYLRCWATRILSLIDLQPLVAAHSHRGMIP